MSKWKLFGGIGSATSIAIPKNSRGVRSSGKPKIESMLPVDEVPSSSKKPQSEFVESILKELARRFYGSLKKITEIRVPSKDVAIADAAEKLFRDINIESQLPRIYAKYKDLPKQEKPDKGHFGKIIDKNLVQVDAEKMREVSAIFITGFGGSANDKRIQSNYVAMEKVVPEIKSALYVPMSEGAEARYIKGAMPYIDRSFIDEEESKNFFKTIFKPKFFDKDGKLLPPNSCQRLVFVAHSIGAREMGSHIRYFKNELIKMKCGKEDIEKYMNKILRFNIGSPVVSGLEISLSRSVNCISLSDFGSKKPESLIKSVYANEFFYQNPVSVVTTTGGFDGDVNKKVLVTLAPGFVPSDGPQPDGSVIPPDIFGHSVQAYIAGMLKDKKTLSMLRACRNFADPKLSDEEVNQTLEMVFSDAKPYPENTSEAEAEVGVVAFVDSLVTSVAYMLERSQKEKKVSSLKIRSETAADSCSVNGPKIIESASNHVLPEEKARTEEKHWQEFIKKSQNQSNDRGASQC